MIRCMIPVWCKMMQKLGLYGDHSAEGFMDCIHLFPKWAVNPATEFVLAFILDATPSDCCKDFAPPQKSLSLIPLPAKSPCTSMRKFVRSLWSATNGQPHYWLDRRTCDGAVVLNDSCLGHLPNRSTSWVFQPAFSSKASSHISWTRSLQDSFPFSSGHFPLP